MGPSEAPPGVDRAVDQAVRLDDFLRSHRGVRITPPPPGSTAEYHAAWTDATGAKVEASHFMLSRLLDYLEAAFR